MAQRATESMTVGAPPEVVYAVVTDVEHYADWVSDLKKVEVLERDAQGRPLEVEYRAAAYGRSTTYALRYDYAHAPEVLTWIQTRGDLTASLEGKYRFESTPEGTLVTYDLETSAEFFVDAVHAEYQGAVDNLKAELEG